VHSDILSVKQVGVPCPYATPRDVGIGLLVLAVGIGFLVLTIGVEVKIKGG